MTEAAATATPVTPTVPSAETPAAVPKPTVSEQFNVLASKEKTLQRRREEIAREKQSLAAEKAEVARQLAESRSLAEKYGSRPKTALEALERYGFSYKDATELALNEGQPTAEQIARAAEERVTALEQRQKDAAEEAKTSAHQAAEAAATQAIEDFKGEINEFISTKSDDYELISLHGAQSVVYDTVEEFFERSRAEDAKKRGVSLDKAQGRVLSIKEASDLVEEYLAEQVKRSLDTKKFKANGQPSKEPQSGKPSDQAPAQRRTVSNEMTSSTPTLLTPRVEEDRMRRAIAALG